MSMQQAYGGTGAVELTSRASPRSTVHVVCMDHIPTHNLHLLAFDTETTGVDVEADRLVTTYAAVIDPQGEAVHELSLLIAPSDPDGTAVAIPQAATDVHGVTDKRARREGLAPKVALRKLLDFLTSRAGDGQIPIAGANLAFDFTILDREWRRHFGTDEVTKFLAHTPSAGVRVLDCLVIDKAIDRYRRGSRRLVNLAAHYGVELSEAEAHDARADAVTAARIAQKQLRHPSLSRITLKGLHDAQVVWKRTQAKSLQAYFRRQPPTVEHPDPQSRTVNGDWPIIPFLEGR